MQHIATPERIYDELFHAVQTGRLFDDSKTFVDANARGDPAQILASYRIASRERDFDLRTFVARHFDLPENPLNGAAVGLRRPIREQIEVMWDALTRTAGESQAHSSLIALPRPFVIPGGRFREVYYWDSYFTMLGLAVSGRVTLLEDMVENFAFLIERIGFIPNGNRSYYCTRSQPPLFVLMVELLAEVRQQPDIVGRYLGHLEREYEFWMSGSERLRPGEAHRRAVAVEGGVLNRYWDDTDTPRQESYSEDLQVAGRCTRDPGELYRDLRAACESGWDFSSRWLGDPQSIASIRTTRVLPVDLNSILFKLESVLAAECLRQGLRGRATRYQESATRRKRLMRELFFDRHSGTFGDLLLPDLRSTGVESLAAAFPLWEGIATPAQARTVADTLRERFLWRGGWVTTLIHSGQQWDAPIGWAPLQWIVYRGLLRYGFTSQAVDGARRWVENVISVYQSSGRMLEKYNVAEIGGSASVGEYGVQNGFGWTNGVLLRFLEELGPVTPGAGRE